MPTSTKPTPMRPEDGPTRPGSGNGPFGCADVDQRIEAYVDDLLPDEQRQAFDAHLAACPTCAAQLALARRIQDGLANLPALRCPDHVSTHVLAEAGFADTPAVIPPRAHPRFLQRRRWWPTAVAAALAAALGIGYLVQPAPGPSRQEIARAQAEVELALSYLGRFGAHAGTAVRHDVIEQRLAGPIARSVQSALTQPE